MSVRRLIPKIARDWSIIMFMVGLLTFNFYALRYIDPGATVDGLAGIYVALQVLIIGFAAASLAATIRWLLFYPLRRTEEAALFGITTQTAPSPGWPGLAAIALDRLTWFAVWLALFSHSV